MRFVGDLATADALDSYLEVLEVEGFAKKTIHTRMGVIFSLLKDHGKETGVRVRLQAGLGCEACEAEASRILRCGD